VRYDADDQPHSATWLELDETERIDTVMDYHRRAGVKLEASSFMRSPMWWSKTKLS
jgi:hypothetical protein